MRIEALDHLVLTVADIDETVGFYCGVLGMEEVVFGGGRRALRFGAQKINLHLAGAEFSPGAKRPTPGAGDLCFLVASLDAPSPGCMRPACRSRKGRCRAPARCRRCGPSMSAIPTAI